MNIKVADFTVSENSSNTLTDMSRDIAPTNPYQPLPFHYILEQEKTGKISKTAVLLANEHHSGQKKFYKRFSHTFLLCNRSCKTFNQKCMPEKMAPRRILTKMTASLFHRLLV